MQTEVDVLGHKVTPKGLKPINSKVEPIRNWKAPSDVHEL